MGLAAAGLLLASFFISMDVSLSICWETDAKKRKKKNVLNGANPHMEERGLLAPQRWSNFLLMVICCPKGEEP